MLHVETVYCTSSFEVHKSTVMEEGTGFHHKWPNAKQRLGSVVTFAESLFAPTCLSSDVC